MIEYREARREGESEKDFEKRDDAHFAKVKENEAKLLALRKRRGIKVEDSHPNN